MEDKQTTKAATGVHRSTGSGKDATYLEELLVHSAAPLHQTDKPSGTGGEGAHVQFLLNEYNSLTDLWKHTDTRFESGINIYLTASAVVVSAIVFLSQRVTDVTLFFAITAFAATSLAIAGVILSNRLLITSFNKAEYIYARDLIRQYFAVSYPEIADHLYFLRNKEEVQLKKSGNVIPQLRPPISILLVIHLWCAFLVWIAIAIVIWLIAPSTNIIVIFISSVIVSSTLFLYLMISRWQKINSFKFRQMNQGKSI